MTAKSAILVGDVGGTHARFAVVDVAANTPWRVGQRLDLDEAFPTFAAALRTYMQRMSIVAAPAAAVIAVAGPVVDGKASFTNRHWQISEQQLQAAGFKNALVINDFSALALAVDVLAGADLRRIGPDLPGVRHAPISIVGAGTGFGVSCLAHSANVAVPIATEGGHIGFAPSDEQEVALLQYLSRQFGRVSVERLLSGPGIENIYRALQVLGGRPALDLSAPEITARAVSGDADCKGVLASFCAILGAVAGDIALAHGARGGVYLAGGIAIKIQDVLAQSAFRARFEQKGRLSPYVKAIPTQLIVNDDVALIGAARAGLTLIHAAR